MNKILFESFYAKDGNIYHFMDEKYLDTTRYELTSGDISDYCFEKNIKQSNLDLIERWQTDLLNNYTRENSLFDFRFGFTQGRVPKLIR